MVLQTKYLSHRGLARHERYMDFNMETPASPDELIYKDYITWLPK